MTEKQLNQLSELFSNNELSFIVLICFGMN